jgi:acyl transferase domain-containing protein
MGNGQPARELHADQRSEIEPIAIIGLACRFPGADNIEAFWRLLRDGTSAIREVPADRWDINVFYDTDPTAPGKMSTRWGGFLGQVDKFDPLFFGISPREAIQIDPQQRLMLELSWEALEDAGQPVSPARTTGHAGVFFGSMWSDYAKLLGGRIDHISQHTAQGQDSSIIAARVSYVLGLQGPSMVVNTASSSSLVAVHLACQSLWVGESKLALAGGVNLIIAPDSMVAMAKLGALAPDNHSRPFGVRPNGYVRGEGGGVVVLKPLSLARADGDSIYCVILSSAVNNDGFSNGLAAPNCHAQQAVIRQAYERAQVSPGAVHFVEAHGTGTSLGDSVEAQALSAVLGSERTSDRPLIIGSVKSNIGHLEAAAGIAGLIKVALAIKHRTIPPTINCDQPNPDIPFDDLRLKVLTTLTPWPDEHTTALAGVSSFGFGGTNCHIVLEELRTEHAPSLSAMDSDSDSDVPPSAITRGVSARVVERTDAATAELFVLSAHTPEALRELAEATSLLMTERRDVSLRDFCYTASVRRSHHAHRLALVCRSKEDLAGQMNRFAKMENCLGLHHGCSVPDAGRKLVFVFSGQRSGWQRMGERLFAREPIFHETLKRCDRALRRSVDLSLFNQFAAGDMHTRLDEGIDPDVARFAIQVSLAALWRSRGIEPDAVVYDDCGETVAAHVMGLLSMEDAARLVCGLSASEPLSFESASVPMYRVTVNQMSDGSKTNVSEQARTLNEPEQLSSIVERLLGESHSTFLEMSLRPTLSKAIVQTIQGLGRQVTVLPDAIDEEDEQRAMLASLGVLYTLGYSIEWGTLYPNGGLCVQLPPYPWQRQRYWIQNAPLLDAIKIASTDMRVAAPQPGLPSNGKASSLSMLTGARSQTLPQSIQPDEPKEPLRRALLAAEPSARRRMLEEYLGEQVAKVLMIPLSKLDVRQPLLKLGIDSLMSLELENRMETDLGISVSLETLFQELTVTQLMARLLSELGGADSSNRLCVQTDEIGDGGDWETLRI